MHARRSRQTDAEESGHGLIHHWGTSLHSFPIIFALFFPSDRLPYVCLGGQKIL